MKDDEKNKSGGKSKNEKKKVEVKYRIGLDIGIASVGWSVLQNDENDEPCRILNRGVRTFDMVEVPKTGESLKEITRRFRGMRRTIRRRRDRLNDVKMICKEKFGIEFDDVISEKPLKNIYEIRYEALSRKISEKEIFRLLVHWCQRRGFKSNRKAELKARPNANFAKGTSENGKILEGIQNNNKTLAEKGYRTIGEFLFFECRDIKTNRDGKEIAYFSTRNKSGDYRFSFLRSQFEDEIRYVFEKQREFGNNSLNADFEKSYLDIFSRQIPYSIGPASPSRFAAKGGSLIENMYGLCTFEGKNGERRASKLTATYEKFMLWQKINNITVFENKKKRPLTQKERQIVASECFKREKVSFADIRKWIEKAGSSFYSFVGLPYGRKEKIKMTEEEMAVDGKYKFKFEILPMETVEAKTKFVTMSSFLLFKKAFGHDVKLSDDEKDTIATAVSYFHDDETLEAALRGTGPRGDKFAVRDELFDGAMAMDRVDAKPGHLSLVAMRKIIPFLADGDIYYVACEKAGYDANALSGESRKKLYTKDIAGKIGSPVVLRSVSQTFKIINAIVRGMGYPPQLIVVETARGLSKTFLERKELENRMRYNEANNQRVVDEIRKLFGFNPKGIDIVKYKLFKEQGEECPYSQRKIEAGRLFSDQKYTEIDHILPYSISFDDSYNNKVLVLSDINQNKGNRTPLQQLAGNQSAIKKFETWVNTSKLSRIKKQNLLTEEVDVEGFAEKNINDTGHATKAVVEHLCKNLIFAPSKFKVPVLTVKGAMTSYYRKCFGLHKNREENDNHHAVDAIIIALFSPALIRKISEFNKIANGYAFDKKSGKYVDKVTGETFDGRLDAKLGSKRDLLKIQLPYDWFLQELGMWMSNNPNSEEYLKFRNDLPYYSQNEVVESLFVSRMPNHKITGKAHDETIRAVATVDGRQVLVKRTSLDKLKLDANGEIANFFEKEKDLELYGLIVERLKMFGNDAKKAFVESVIKQNGCVVRKIKTFEPATLIVELSKTGGAATNNSMVRIDVFSKKHKDTEKYYFIPIYVADFYRAELPNKACVALKSREEWLEMDDNFTFLFSLYKGDLIWVESDRGLVGTIERQVVVEKNGEEVVETRKEKVCVQRGFSYYNTADISTASITTQSHNREITFSNFGIQKLKKIKKMQVSILGEISECPFEKRNIKTLLGKKDKRGI